MNTTTSTSALAGALQQFSKLVIRQVKFPSLMRAITESLLFSVVFLVAGSISLGVELVDMLVPMVPVVFVMMLSMVLSGVYRPEITHSIVNVYVHSAYGFLLGAALFVVTVLIVAPQFATLKFEFFFLFFSFFVVNTMRPIISGTDFMDGGGRRTN